jgi:hypothetical protein
LRLSVIPLIPNAVSTERHYPQLLTIFSIKRAFTWEIIITMASALSHIPGPNLVLGSSKRAPETGPNLLSPVYGERNESGLYDAIADQVERMGADTLANLEYPDDFTREIEGWSKNHRYVDRKGDELRTAIVGEIAGPEWGTILRAHGNYFSRDGDNVRFSSPPFILPLNYDSSNPLTTIRKSKTLSPLPFQRTHPPGCTTLSLTRSSPSVKSPPRTPMKMRATTVCVFFTMPALLIVDLPQDPIVKNWTKASKPDSENHDVMMLTMLSKYAVSHHRLLLAIIPLIFGTLGSIC